MVSKATQFKKGQSGNPAGRGIGNKDTVAGSLKRMLRAKAPDEIWRKLHEIGIKDARGSNAKALAQTLIILACRGNIQAMRLIKEYTEPTPLKIEGELLHLSHGFDYLSVEAHRKMQDILDQEKHLLEAKLINDDG